MFMPPSERSPNAPNHFHLAREGRLLAGVCAGLAEYPGWMGAYGWRAVFVVGALITTVPAAIAYAVMWKVMHDESHEPSRGPVWKGMHDESHEPSRGPVARRERRQAPMPKVSWSMRRRIKRLVALVEEVRTRHDRPVGDLVLQTLDAIKLLAPRLQKPRTVRDERLAEAAFVRFPALVEKLKAMSPDDVAEGSDPAVRTPGSVLREHLRALHDGFNQEAAREVARQLRLRDLGGIILIDFIDMKSADHRKVLYQSMVEYMAGDRAQHTILPLSKFGLMQITRQRVRPEMTIDTSEVCPTCQGTGSVNATVLVTGDIERDLDFVLRSRPKGKVSLHLHPFVEAFYKKGLRRKQREWFLKYQRWIPVYGDSAFPITKYVFYDENDDEIRL